MKFTKLVAIAVFSSAMGAGAVTAQSGVGGQPAEFPPASFLGKQYVDSAGCVFIRAGIDGAVSWVPRVTRSRSGVCGFKPTFAGQVTSAQSAPVQTTQVEQITLEPPVAAAAATAAAPVAPAPQPRPARVVQAAPAPAPQVVRQVARPAPPIVETVAQSRPVVATAPVALQGAAACEGASAISGQFLRSDRLPVRCGPQTTPIVGTGIAAGTAPRGALVGQGTRRVAAASQPIQVAPDTRIVPRHVAANRANTTNVQVPEGYRTVWSDGRLNPRRAEQSLAGHAAMSLIWTSTVPRRLINQADGRDVTASVPLVFPFTDFEAQQRELGQVTLIQRNGQVLKRIVRSVRRTVTPTPRQARVTTVQRSPVFSSRSAPQVAPKAKAQPNAEAAGNGFVQVGAFADTDAAHRLAKKVQRMGMPVRVGRFTRDGQTTRLVIAGPFDGSKGVSSAVTRLRGAGYNAFAR